MIWKEETPWRRALATYVQKENDPDLGLFAIKMINCVHSNAIKLDIKLNGAPVCMKLDTSASVSLM